MNNDIPEKLLEIKDLRVQFSTGEGLVRAVDGVSYTIPRGRTLCVVGESGSGKSVTARAILQIVHRPGKITGGQRFPVHWGGDNSSTYPSMAETLRGGLSLGLCGFGYWSHDISGFNDTATPDLYKRWVAFGLLSSHSRLHGNASARMPWLFDDESVDVLRFFNNLKQHLMPYLLDASREANECGYPMLRAMVLEFPDDPTCRYLDTQYMLGEALLVAPIFNDRGQVTCYLPPEQWAHLLTGETATGGWRTETHGYLSLPLWVRGDAASRWDCLSAPFTPFTPFTAAGEAQS